MNEIQKEKLERFFDDVILVEVVKSMLFACLLKKQETDDVNILAASRIAIDRFLDGWRELEKFKRKESGAQPLEKNIGL